MKTIKILLSSRVDILKGATLLLAAFLILQIIYGLESFAAGETTNLNWGQSLFQYTRVHWASIVVRIGIIVAVFFWSRNSINLIHKDRELVRQIPETVADGIYLVDRNGRMTFANSAAERILGVPRDVILRRTYNDVRWQITKPDGAPFPDNSQPFVRVMQTGTPVYGVEQRIERPDGTRAIVSVNAAPIQDADGKVVGEVGSLTDITERKRAEAALQRSERRYRLLFEGVSVMSVLTKPGEDELPVIVDCNDLFAATLGYTRCEVAGRPAADFYTADSRKKMAEGGYQRAMRGQLLTEERELLTKDGKVINTLVSAVPDVDASGKSVGTQAMFVNITQRKYAEEELRRSEERYKNIVENASDIIYRTDRDGRLEFCNPTSSRILKYSNEEFIGQHFLSFVHPNYRREVRKYYQEQYEKQIPSTYHEFIAIGRDGSEHWIGQNVQILKIENEISGFQAVARDITDQKNAEGELLRRNQELGTLNRIGQALNRLAEPSEILEMIFDSIRQVMGPRDMYIALYDEAKQWITFPIYTVGGKRIDRQGRAPGNYLSEYVIRTKAPLFIPRNMKQSRENLRIELTGPQSKCYLAVPMVVGGKAIGVIAVQDYEREDAYDSGHVELLGTIASQAAHALENARLFAAVQQELTERKRTEEALRQSEARHRALLEGLPDAIWHMNRDGILLDYKPPRDMVPRLELASYIGKRIDQVRPFPATEQALQNLDQVMTSGEPATFEYQISRDQTVYDRQARIVPSGSDEVLMIVSDITDRKKVDRLKNEFISMVSHELRTPLTSIRGSLGLIAGGTAGAISAQAKTLVDIAYKNSERLILLINDILDIEKIESGKMAFELKPVELMSLLAQAIEANANYGHQFGVEYSLTNGLPNVRVNVDPDRLTQVITNLLSNAAKFSPRDCIVDVGVSRFDSNVRVSIHDCGPGIPEEFQLRIFQKFAQADSSNTRQKGGTGLGLNISKAIVERLGGKIGFETSTDSGTTFYFDLPEWQPQPMTVKHIPARKPRVLICEDDHDTAMLLKLMLEQSGYASEIAYDAGEARELLSRNDYAGMTLDLVLPDKDGISFIRELRDLDKTRDLSIVVVSMCADKGKSELNGDAVQVIDWISKPIDAKRLLNAVKQAVARTPNRRARILHVEDDPDILQVVSVILGEVASLDPAITLRTARQLLQKEAYDLVILDLDMPDGSGLDLIPMLREQEPPIPAVIFSVEEVKKETAAMVSATLVKSHTSNEKLVRTIQSLIRAPVAG
jgi:PAS domain S-box-containing protein